MTKKGNPITVKRYSPRYNVLYQRRSLLEDVGAFKLAGRAVRNFGLNKHVPRAQDALAEISDFLNENRSTASGDMRVTQRDAKYNPFTLTHKPLQLSIDKNRTAYRLYNKGKDYYLWVQRKGFLNDRMMHIKAGDSDEFKDKLAAIFQSDTARAKLEYQVSALPGVNSKWTIPGLPRHSIEFLENKLTGEYKAPAYNRIGRDGEIEAFDSPVGSVERKQITFYMPLDSFENYSKCEDQGQKKLSVKDQTWTKLNALGQYMQVSSEPEELLGNIISQTYAGQEIDPKHVAQMTHNMKEDFIHNLNGYGTRNGKVVGQSEVSTYGRYGKRWPLGADPLRGGRFWEDLPPSLEEIVLMFYQPQADGSAKMRYEDHPEKFMNDLERRLKIRPDDRQYTMNYARKALGVKTALRLLQDEINSITLNDKELSPEERKAAETKWSDLTCLKDRIFNHAGDLRDYLRKGDVGYSAYAEAVGLDELPDLKADQDLIAQGAPDLEGFKKTAVRGMFHFTENYTYYDNLFGWQGREYVGRQMHKLFANKLFERDVPPVVCDTGVVMLMEAVDKTSRRLKLFNDIFVKDADLSSNLKAVLDRLKRFDTSGAHKIFTKQGENLREIISGREEYARTNLKRMIMQNEGVMLEKEIWPPYRLPYEGNKPGLFTGAYPSHIAIWRQSQEFVEKMKPFFTDIARIMKAHQAGLINERMKESGGKMTEGQTDDVYQRPEMRALGVYIQDSAKEMATKFFERNEIYYRNADAEDLEPLFKHVQREFVNVLQMAVNVVAMVAYNPAHPPEFSKV